MKLTEIIAVWDLLHVKDIGFCDLEKAIDEVVGVENDVCANDFDVTGTLTGRFETQTQTQKP